MLEKVFDEPWLVFYLEYLGTTMVPDESFSDILRSQISSIVMGSYFT